MVDGRDWFNSKPASNPQLFGSIIFVGGFDLLGRSVRIIIYQYFIHRLISNNQSNKNNIECEVNSLSGGDPVVAGNLVAVEEVGNVVEKLSETVCV